jgi:hypothetical protein
MPCGMAGQRSFVIIACVCMCVYMWSLSVGILTAHAPKKKIVKKVFVILYSDHILSIRSPATEPVVDDWPDELKPDSPLVRRS